MVDLDFYTPRRLHAMRLPLFGCLVLGASLSLALPSQLLPNPPAGKYLATRVYQECHGSSDSDRPSFAINE